MSAEPEDIAAVEGDKAETCPTCGGPCTKRLKESVINLWEYKSLVKGEVVAEGTLNDGDLEKWDAGDNLLCVWKVAGDIPVLVVRAARKENARTGGKERDANSS